MRTRLVRSIPKEFIPSIDQGIREAMTTGVLAGYPLDHVAVELHDGSFHESESSELAFKMAGAMAIQDAAKKAKPVLLEPVMNVEVLVPQEHTSDVMADLSSRRGQIQSQDECDGMQRIIARVPLPGMFGYGTDLRSRTFGRGTFAMQFARYQPCESGDDQDSDDLSRVGAPRKPMPTLRDSSVALPEPTEDDRRDQREEGGLPS